MTISDLVFAFVASNDGESLLQKIPSATWSKLGIDATLEDSSTTVVAGKLRRLLAQCRLVVQHSTSTQPEAGVQSTPATPLTQPMWNELAPPRLTPEAVTHLMDQFTTNYPGELLTADSTPSIRLLSVVHHTLKPGQSLKYIPWQIRMSQKQYQEMTEAKTHKAIRSEAQILGALLDETPEIPVENMKLSAEWLMRTQQVFRNAWVMCGAAHLHIFKKYDDKFFSLAMKKHAPESMLRSVNLSELLEADKFLRGEIISLVNPKWKLDDALHEMSSARADMYGVLQPRPKAPQPKPPNPDPPKRPPKADPKVKKTTVKGASHTETHQMDLCTFMWVDGKKQTLVWGLPVTKHSVGPAGLETKTHSTEQHLFKKKAVSVRNLCKGLVANSAGSSAKKRNKTCFFFRRRCRESRLAVLRTPVGEALMQMCRATAACNFS